MSFIIYPDVWIRDLPLLDFGEGAYIANRATLGTNLPLRDGTIIVDHIRIGSNTVIGHLALIAAGTIICDNTEVAVNCAVGIRCRIGSNTIIQGRTDVSHRSVIGDNTVVGTASLVGTGAKIGSNISCPEGSRIPMRGRINNQSDADRLLSFPFLHASNDAEASKLDCTDEVDA